MDGATGLNSRILIRTNTIFPDLLVLSGEYICYLFLQHELALTPPSISLVVKFFTVLHNVQFSLLTKSLKLPGSQSTHTDDAFSIFPTSQTKMRKLKMRSGLGLVFATENNGFIGTYSVVNIYYQ